MDRETRESLTVWEYGGVIAKFDGVPHLYIEKSDEPWGIDLTGIRRALAERSAISGVTFEPWYDFHLHGSRGIPIRVPYESGFADDFTDPSGFSADDYYFASSGALRGSFLLEAQRILFVTPGEAFKARRGEPHTESVLREWGAGR